MTIKESIRLLALAGEELYCKVCVVDAVHEQARTIDCSPLDESAPLLAVNLQANQGSETGVVAFPAVGSHVVVAFISPAVAVVVLTGIVEKVALKIGDTTAEITPGSIVINGGTLGGLVKIEALTSKLNDLIDAFNAHTHELLPGAVAVTGSATAQANPAPVVVPAITSLHPGVTVSDYEDNKVTH